MPIVRQELKVLWSGLNFDTLSPGGQVESDEINLSEDTVEAQIHLKADTAGTPASTDIVLMWLRQTGGDPDGSGSDEFDPATVESMLFLAALDTSATGNDPAGKTVPLPLPQKGAILVADGASEGTSNSITVSATITEQRST